MDMGGWLRGLGLGKHEAAFRDNGIDESVLPHLTVEDLKELGVASVGDRRKLLTAISALSSPTSSEEAASPRPSPALPKKVYEVSAERRPRCTAAQAEAKKLGMITQLLGVRAPNDFADAFREMDRHPPDAILLVADTLTVINHPAVFDYATAHHLPDMEELDLLAHIGGLMAYSIDQNEVFDRLAAQSDRILHGAKPADLPLELPTRFHFSINLKTAHSLGLTIPEATQLRADDVIE